MDDLLIHSYIHCRACTVGGQTERLEVGISRTGMIVNCKKHGIVGHFSLGQLGAELDRGPRCDCCPGGTHWS